MHSYPPEGSDDEANKARPDQQIIIFFEQYKELFYVKIRHCIIDNNLIFYSPYDLDFYLIAAFKIVMGDNFWIKPRIFSHYSLN